MSLNQSVRHYTGGIPDYARIERKTGLILNLTSSNIYSDFISATNISTTNISATNAYVINAKIDNVSVSSLDVSNIIADNAIITNITSASIFSTDIESDHLTTSDIAASDVVISNISSTNARIQDITSDNIFALNFSAMNFTATNINNLDVNDPIISMGVGNGIVGDTLNEGITVEYKFAGSPSWGSILRYVGDQDWYISKNSSTQPTPLTFIPSLTRGSLHLDGNFANFVTATDFNSINLFTLNVTSANLFAKDFFTQNITSTSIISNSIATTNITSSLSNLGTIASGTWNGDSISTSYTDAKVINISGALDKIFISGSGTNPTVTVSDTYAGQSSITTLGTISSGTWHGGLIPGQYGGTGVNNAGKTIVLANNLTTSGNFPLTLVSTTSTTVAMPATGTGTLSTLAEAETLTNKTLTTPIIGSILNGTSTTNLPTTGNITFTNTNAAGGVDEVLYVASAQNVLAKSIDSTTSFFIGGDITKKLLFDLSTQTTAKTLTLKSAATGNDVYTFPEVGTAANFVMSEGTQTINGNKTLSGTTNLSGLSATSLLALDGSKNISNTTSGISPTFTTVTASTSVLTPSLDRAAAGALTIGGTTATSLAIGHGTIPITETGLITKPAQPLFIYSLSTGVAAVTGEGTAYTMVFDTSVANVGGYFNGTTFTAPVTGKYRVSCVISLNGITVAMNAGYIYVTVVGTSAKTWIKLLNNPGINKDSGNIFTSDLNFLIPMTATDTLTFIIQIFGAVTKLAGTQGTVGAVQPCTCSCTLDC